MNCTHWLGKLANLKVARTGLRGIAPHKPLMLLTVIDLIESGDIPDGWVRYDVRLFSRFRDYWELVQDRQRNSSDITMLFNVLGGYYFTCALTGYRLDTEQSDQTGRILDGRATPARRVRNAMPRIPNQTTSIVQAAHIHQRAISGNDDPRNGLALTPDAHWMFDAGLWTAMPKGDDLLVQIAIGRFSESSSHGRILTGFHQKPLHFHDHVRLRPDPEHFEWHRTKHRICLPCPQFRPR